MLSHLVLLVTGVIFGVSAADRHPSNNVAKDHPNDMTAIWEQTLFLLPIPRRVALQLTGNKFKLLTPIGLPAGYLKDDEHVLFINNGQQYDIRQGSLVVPRLASYNTYIPFVDVSKDGRTPFQVLMQSYTDSVLALLGVLSFDQLEVANFDPSNGDAYKRIGTDQISAAVSQDKVAPLARGILRKGLLGSILGIDLEDQRFQYLTTKVKSSPIPAQTFIDVANQPYLHSLTHLTLRCGLAQVLFNQTYSAPFFSSGSVQVFPPTLPSATSWNKTIGYTGIAAYIQKAGLGDDCKTYSRSA